MVKLGSAVLELSTDSSKLVKGIDDAEHRTGRLEGRFAGAGTAARALGGAVTALAVGALADAAKAAAEDEANVLRLQTAIENSGASWEAESGRIEQRIKKGQQLAFADSEVRDSLADLTIATGSVDEAMKRQTLAMDLARAKNISLEAATKLMGKVTDENVNVFARMGITVRKGADASELFAAVQQKTAGAAERYGQTTEAAMFRINDAIGEWKESIGAALGPAQTYIAMLPGVSTGLTAVGGAAGAALPMLRATPGALGQMLGMLNPISLATKAWTVAQAALNLVMSANPIAIVVLALAALAAGLKFAYDNSAEFRGMVQQLFGWLGNLLSPLKFVADAVMDLAKMLGIVPAETEQMKTEVLADFQAMGAGADASTASMGKAVTGNAKEMAHELTFTFEQMKHAGVGHAQDMEIDVTLAALGMSRDVRDAVAEMVSGVSDLSEKQREKVIYDLQVAKLQAALRARGMSEEVVKQIDRMVFDSRQRTEKMREVGEQYVTSLAGGIRDSHDRARAAAVALAKVVEGGVNDTLIMHSPSEIAIDQGSGYGSSLSEGLLRTLGLVGNTSAQIGAEIPKKVAQGIASGSGTVGAAAARMAQEALERLRQALIQQGIRVADEQSRFVIGEGSHLPQNFGGTFIGPGDFDPSGRIPGATIITGLAGGGIGKVPLGAKPRFWTVVNGENIPIFHQGGVMPHTGLAFLERGEEVTPAAGGGGHQHPLVINIDGRRVARAMARPQQERVRLAGQGA